MSDVLERATFTDLVEIPAKDALAVFTTPNAIDPILARVKREIDQFKGEVRTPTGRKAVASIAYKVSQSKTALLAVGKKLADEQKEIPKKIDACRRKIEETLDGYRDEVRKPLTDWETAEKARSEKHLAEIKNITLLGSYATTGAIKAPALRDALAIVQAVAIGPACEEFISEYAIAKETAIAALKPAIEAREKYEAEQAELAKLRAESAARAEADRIAKIAADAAEAAALEAERNKTAIAEAEKRAVEAAAKVKAEHVAAIEAERAATAKREADTKHKRAINGAALAAFIEHGIEDEVARSVIKLIVAKKIPAISINY